MLMRVMSRRRGGEEGEGEEGRGGVDDMERALMMEMMMGDDGTSFLPSSMRRGEDRRPPRRCVTFLPHLFMPSLAPFYRYDACV